MTNLLLDSSQSMIQMPPYVYHNDLDRHMSGNKNNKKKK